MLIIDKVRSFLSEGDVEDRPLPWESLAYTDNRRHERAATIKAIQDHLGVYPDGSEVPLTLRQRLFFSDSLSKLHYKIRKVRRECSEIVKVIGTFHPWEDEIKNTRLVRHFIIECLSPFKRYTLEITNATYDEYPTGQSSWSTYIASWIFISGTLIFFLYWIFAWGLYEGEGTLKAWGKVYGTAAATDILLVQVTKVFILYYLPSQAMQPQLKRIRKVLADISMNYINKSNENDDKNTAYSAGSRSGNGSGSGSEISVVQHMSAACRAAWSHELKDLPSAWLLRQVRLDQSLSPLKAFQ